MSNDAELMQDGLSSRDAVDELDDIVIDEEASDEELGEGVDSQDFNHKQTDKDDPTDNETTSKEPVETNNEPTKTGDGENIGTDAASVNSTSHSFAANEKEEEQFLSHPLGDLHRLGLEVVSGDDESTDASYDIIAIHGLDAWSRAAWISGEGEPYKTWLKNDLTDLPGASARVMIYGFDPGDQAGKTWMPYGVYKEAEALLVALMQLRGSDIRKKRRPIWFISEDIGGLIVKAALTIASRDESQYADVLNCTRSLIFFNYPHRYISTSHLETRVFQHITMLEFVPFRPYHLETLRATKNLSQTIVAINDAFTQTNLMWQVKMVNIRATADDPGPFEMFMTSVPAPFVAHASLNRPYNRLTSPTEDALHEFRWMPDMNWLVGDLPENLYPTLRRLLNQAPPFFPYQKFERFTTTFPELENFLQPGSERIIHLRCSPVAPFTTEQVSERARLFLCQTEEVRRRMLYFRFCDNDIRFTNVSAMLQSFLIQLLFQRFKVDEAFVRQVVERFRVAGRTNLNDLLTQLESFWSRTDIASSVILIGRFDECEKTSLSFLSYIKEFMSRTETDLKILIITSRGSERDEMITSALTQFPPTVVNSIVYKSPEPPKYDFRAESSLIAQERPYLSRGGREQDVIHLLSRYRKDTSLCEILATWLKSVDDPFSSGAELFQWDEPPSAQLIFKTALMQMPATHRAWAQTLLCFLMTSLRPLRLHEFCWISDHLLPTELEQSSHRKLSHESDAWSHAVGILDMFNGLLKAEYGEVRFRHPFTINWLLNAEDSTNSQSWYLKDLEDRWHELVLETCLEYLGDQGDTSEISWAERFPYALEFWTYHYRHTTGTTKDRANNFLKDDVLRGRWIDGYRQLQKPFQMPRPETTSLLGVAAYFGLEDVVKEALENRQHGDGAWCQALIESIRRRNEVIFDLLLDFHKPRFSFDDEVLHEAVSAASFCLSSRIFRQAVGFIPEPPYPIPELERMERRKATGENRDILQQPHSLATIKEEAELETSKDDNLSEADSSVVNEEGGTGKQSDPFQWLYNPLIEASTQRLGDIVTELISKGADPNPPKGAVQLDRTALHQAAANSLNDIVELLIQAGADVDATDSLGYTPLGLATTASTVTTLLENGAAIDARTGPSKLLPVQFMAKQGNFVALEAILDFQDFHQYYGEETNEDYPINLAAERRKVKCLDVLLRHGFNPNIANETKETPLCGSIKIGRIDMCHLLLERGANPNYVPDGSTPPLHEAASEGRIDIMELLLEHKADIEIKEPTGVGWGRTPLQTAIDLDKVSAAEFLIEKGANPNVQDLGEMRPLYVAAERGMTAVVRKLVEAKAEINSLSRPEKWTPAHGAFDHPDTLVALIELGADLSITTTRDYTPLDIALINGCDVTMEDILAKSKVDFDLSRAGAQRALVCAVDGGFVEAVEVILEAGADVNTVDAEAETNKNESLTSIAMQISDDAMLRKLLEFRPDLNQVSDLQNTALHCIVRATPLSSVKLVVNAGGRLDALNKNRITPLLIAADAENIEVFKYMLSKQAAQSVLHITPRDQVATVLHMACFKGNMEMVQLLLDKGMDVNFPCDGMWGTPLMSTLISYDESRQEQTMELVQFLLEKGADPNKHAGFFELPIITASLSESSKCTQLILDQKVSVDVKDRFNHKPVHMACCNSLEVLDLLGLSDSEFTAKDIVGRVPLHYAVCSGQADLLREVIARSARVGISIDVEDDDGWTPLLWAARNSPALGSPHEKRVLATDMVTILLEEGAKPDVQGKGFSTTFSPSQVAYYHRADEIGDLILSKQGKEPPKTKRRGKAGSGWCNCCLLKASGSFFKCEDCYSFAVCFKCYRSRSLFHPDHSFRDEGDEWDDTEEEDDGKAEAGDRKPLEPIKEEDEDQGSDEGFDDEIVG